MTIYEIQERTKLSAPYFFVKDTLKFFGQSMSKFKVRKQADGRYLITQPINDGTRVVGTTERLFNPETNKLEFVEQ